jgi:arsenical pump membrane protein
VTIAPAYLPAITWAIAGAATLGVIARPWNLPEALWAVLGAAFLVALNLLPAHAALDGILRGTDVYLFLIGMMLLAEIAREEGLFDWLAAGAARFARGSATRLFVLIYAVGIIVTTFLSNDATAVVLTPAVAAVARAAKVREALPFLLICALIANAASFVLPISNPANLVIYGSEMPPLTQWLPRYALPSAASIAVTFLVLWWTQRRALRQQIAADIALPTLSRSGKAVAIGIAATSIVLLAASSLDMQLGLPTALAGIVTAASVLVIERKAPWRTIRHISWGVVPLVAGLFVLVEALAHTGLIEKLSAVLQAQAALAADRTAWGAGLIVAFVANAMNNLPAGLIAASAVQAADVPEKVRSAILIGVDLGPNLSVTGSLATILWLTALRRDGQKVGAVTFLKLGCLVMPPALIAALAAALWLH